MNRVKNILGPGILVIIIPFLMSCEEMFTTNIFDSLDNLDLSDMSTEEQAVAILDDASGAIDGLSGDEIDDLVDDLTDLANDTSAGDGTRMQAAAAAAEVEMAASGADETINNLSDLVTDMVNDDLTVDDPTDILTSIFSDSSGNLLSAAEIEAQLEAMLAAAALLETYGSVMGEDGIAPPGVSADTLAVTALVVGLVGILSDGGNSTAAIAAAITDPDPETAIDNLNGTFPDLNALTADGGLEALFGADMANTIEGGSLITSLLDQM